MTHPSLMSGAEWMAVHRDKVRRIVEGCTWKTVEDYRSELLRPAVTGFVIMAFGAVMAILIVLVEVWGQLEGAVFWWCLLLVFLPALLMTGAGAWQLYSNSAMRRRLQAAPAELWHLNDWWIKGRIAFGYDRILSRAGAGLLAALIILIGYGVVVMVDGFTTGGITIAVIVSGLVVFLTIVLSLSASLLVRWMPPGSVIELQLLSLPPRLNGFFRATLKLRAKPADEAGLSVKLSHWIHPLGKLDDASRKMLFCLWEQVLEWPAALPAGEDGIVSVPIEFLLPGEPEVFPTGQAREMPIESIWWLEVEGTGAYERIVLRDTVPVFAAEETA